MLATASKHLQDRESISKFCFSYILPLLDLLEQDARKNGVGSHLMAYVAK